MQNRAVPRGCSHSTSQIGSITAILILFLPLFPHITHMAGEGQQGGGHWSFTDISTPWELKCPFCGQCSTALAWKMKVDLVWLCQVSTCLSSIRAQFPTLSHGSSLPGGSSSCLVHSRVAPPRKISVSRTEHWLLKNTSGHREFPFPLFPWESTVRSSRGKQCGPEHCSGVQPLSLLISALQKAWLNSEEALLLSHPVSQNHRTIESLRLEKTPESIESNL